MTPEQHEQQRRWVSESLQAEAQRELNHDTYPRRASPATVSADRPQIEGGDAE